jgi:DNA polymerase elongation subunit (family B)
MRKLVQIQTQYYLKNKLFQAINRILKAKTVRSEEIQAFRFFNHMHTSSFKKGYILQLNV